jgi:uncharacterized membrane protein YbjE (DUF340 family)
MDQLLSLVLLFSFLAIGVIVHRLRLAPRPAVVDSAARWTLYLLLASMGLRLAQSRDIAGRLGEIGALALTTAAATTAGTVLVLLAFRPLFDRFEGRSTRGRFDPEGGATASAAPFSLKTHLRGPLRLLLVVVAAFVIGLALPPIPLLSSGSLTTWTLYAMLAFIGMQMSANEVNLASMLLRPATLLAPIGTIIGSLGASLAVGAFFRLSAGKALALGAGFGWYSLSGVLITDLGDPMLGSASFLANMLRETIALLTIPFLASTGRAELAIGAGGATSMDVTLPLIERCAGPQSVPLSIAHGLALSLLVPLLVPIFYRLG